MSSQQILIALSVTSAATAIKIFSGIATALCATTDNILIE
jgi:hypothetical protein